MSPMNLEYAEWLAGHLVKRISPYLKRVEIAGSIRRQCSTVGDIEIVAVPYMNGDLFAGQDTPILDPVRVALSKIGTIKKGGDRYIRVHLTKTDQHADIFIVWPPAQWGSIYAIRTGPASLGRYVVTRCRENGIAHTKGHAVEIETGRVIPTPTEEDFFGLAGVDCVAPERRDTLAKQLLARGTSAE